MTFPVAGMLSQPGGELPGVGDRAFPEPEERADLGTVILERPARPLIQPQIRGGHLHLAGNVGDRLIRKLPAAAGKPAAAVIELQQQREGQPGRAALPGDLGQLAADQRPVLDELVLVDSGHETLRPSVRLAEGADAIGRPPAKVPGIAGGGTLRTTARMLPEAAARGADPEPRKCRPRTSKRNFAGGKPSPYPQTVSVTEGEHLPGGRRGHSVHIDADSERLAAVSAARVGACR